MVIVNSTQICYTKIFSFNFVTYYTYICSHKYVTHIAYMRNLLSHLKAHCTTYVPIYDIVSLLYVNMFFYLYAKGLYIQILHIEKR